MKTGPQPSPPWGRGWRSVSRRRAGRGGYPSYFRNSRRPKAYVADPEWPTSFVMGKSFGPSDNNYGIAAPTYRPHRGGPVATGRHLGLTAFQSVMGDHIFATLLFSETFRFCFTTEAETRSKSLLFRLCVSVSLWFTRAVRTPKQSEIGFGLSDFGTLLCIFNNLLALFSKKSVFRVPRSCISNLESQISNLVFLLGHWGCPTFPAFLLAFSQ